MTRLLPLEAVAEPADPSLHVESLGFTYRRRVALTDVTFTAETGVTAVLGPNGAGKSTLFQLLAGSLCPSSGSVSLTVDGCTLDLPQRRTRIGYMPQDARFFPRFTPRDFVTYCAWLRGIPMKERAAAVEQALGAAGVAEVADRRITRLSGGMRQRANLASAIVNRPMLLLLDEPTNSLDIENRAAFRTLVRENSRDCVTLLSSHDVDQIEAVAERLVVLHAGALVYSGKVAFFLQERGEDDLESAYLNLLREHR